MFAGEELYVVAWALMWFSFLFLPFSPFILMIEDPVLRYSFFGSVIGLQLSLLFTGCSLKIYNRWREHKIEESVEKEHPVTIPELSQEAIIELVSVWSSEDVPRDVTEIQQSSVPGSRLQETEKHRAIVF